MVSPKAVEITPEVMRLLRNARKAARGGSCIAKAVGRIVFVAIALLVVTVGTLATESRLPLGGRYSSSWHVSKSSRMAEFGGEKLAPVQSEDAQPSAPIVQTETFSLSFCRRPSLPLAVPESISIPESHGLRAPPQF